jgi:hypothetical protein
MDSTGAKGDDSRELVSDATEETLKRGISGYASRRKSRWKEFLDQMVATLRRIGQVSVPPGHFER